MLGSDERTITIPLGCGDNCPRDVCPGRLLYEGQLSLAQTSHWTNVRWTIVTTPSLSSFNIRFYLYPHHICLSARVTGYSESGSISQPCNNIRMFRIVSICTYLTHIPCVIILNGFFDVLFFWSPRVDIFRGECSNIQCQQFPILNIAKYNKTMKDKINSRHL